MGVCSQRMALLRIMVSFFLVSSIKFASAGIIGLKRKIWFIKKNSHNFKTKLQKKLRLKSLNLKTFLKCFLYFLFRTNLRNFETIKKINQPMFAKYPCHLQPHQNFEMRECLSHFPGSDIALVNICCHKWIMLILPNASRKKYCYVMLRFFFANKTHFKNAECRKFHQTQFLSRQHVFQQNLIIRSDVEV